MAAKFFYPTHMFTHILFILAAIKLMVANQAKAFINNLYVMMLSDVMYKKVELHVYRGNDVYYENIESNIIHLSLMDFHKSDSITCWDWIGEDDVISPEIAAHAAVDSIL